MRFVYLLLITLFVASCANNRIRYVRVKKGPVVLTEAEAYKETTKRPSAQERVGYSEEVFEEQEETTAPQETAATVDSHEDVRTTTSKASKTTTPEKHIDTSNEDKVAQAEEAERKAVNAKRSLIISLAMMFIPFLSGFFLIPFIIGWVLLAQSNRSRYITPYGQEQARIASILRYVILGIIILTILAVFIAFLLFW